MSMYNLCSSCHDKFTNISPNIKAIKPHKVTKHNLQLEDDCVNKYDMCKANISILKVTLQ